MVETKPSYRIVKVPCLKSVPIPAYAAFHFRIRRLETDFMFEDNSVHTFTNWDIKGCRERFYMDEFINVPVEEYLRMATESGEIVEFGIKTSEIKKFIEKKFEFFEDLLLGAAGCGPLFAEENL